jgi:dephospho-CoA kinase
VRARLAHLGVPTIDADVLARDVVAPGTAGLEAVVRRFGPTVIAEDGSLDRKALGAIVFADCRARCDLEAIVHPAVRSAIERWYDSLDPDRYPIAVADIPLLIETGRHTEFDDIVLTVCSPERQLQRLLARGLTEEQSRQRIAAQLPAAAKLPHASFVINTDGTYEQTDAQVDMTWRRLVGNPP